MLGGYRRAAVGGADKGGLFPQVRRDGLADDAVVGTAEQHRVRPLQRRAVARDGLAHRGVAGAVPALDQGHEVRAGDRSDLPPRAGRPERRGKGAAADAGLRGNDAERPRAGDLRHPGHPGFQHAEGGHGVGVEDLGGVGGERAAGDDDGLHTVRGDQVQILHRHAPQLLPCFGAVGQAPGVPEIDDVFLRQQLPQRLHRRQAAEPGVKNTDCSVVHSRSFYR